MSSYKQILLLSSATFCLSFWLYRYYLQRPILPPKFSRITVTGMITSLPYTKGQSQYFELGRLTVVESALPVRLLSILVKSRITPRLSYGDKVRVSGALAPSGGISFPEVELIGASGSSLKKTLLSFREKKLEQVISRSLPQPESGLLSGVLLGSKGGLLYDWEDTYRKVGLTHVVVASGYNISILIGFLGALTRLFGRRASFALSALGVLIFTLMLGGEPPIFRAAVMGIVTLWGNYLGRAKDSLRVLLLSAVIMLLIDPGLIDSLSFQLSFMACLGLIVLATPLRLRFQLKALNFLGLGEDFFTALAASLFVFPIISYYFGSISIGSFLVNTLVLWTIPPVMVLGVIMVLVGLLSIEAAQVIGWLPWLLLRFFNLCASFFARFAIEWKMQLAPLAILTYYLILGGICLSFRIRSHDDKRS